MLLHAATGTSESWGPQIEAFSKAGYRVIAFDRRITWRLTGSTSWLRRPGFHHLHMNSVNPSAAIDEFLKVSPASTRVIVAGFEGVKSANNVSCGPPRAQHAREAARNAS